MIALAWMTALTLGVAPGSDSIRLALPGLMSPNVDAANLKYYSQFLSQQLTLEGARVVTPEEMAQVIGLERQRQLLGCGDNSGSCLTELANALGVEALVMGTVGRFDGQFQVDVKVISATDAHALVAYSHRVEGESELLDDLTQAAHQLAAGLRVKLHKTADAMVATSGPTNNRLRSYVWIPTVAAGVFGAAAAFAFVETVNHHNDLVQGRPIANPTAYGQEGSTYQTAGWILASASLAGLASAATLYVLGAPARARATVALAPRGATFGMEVTLP